MKNYILLIIVCSAALIAQSTPKQQPPVMSCGFRGTMHDCHCAARTAKIHEQLEVQCSATTKDEKEMATCMRRLNHDWEHVGFHCAIAERPTEFDVFPEEGFTWEAETIKSNLGEFCKKACKPHQCRCTEESCDFK